MATPCQERMPVSTLSACDGVTSLIRLTPPSCGNDLLAVEHSRGLFPVRQRSFKVVGKRGFAKLPKLRRQRTIPVWCEPLGPMRS